MAEAPARVAVAYSGGLDSSVLLHAAHRLVAGTTTRLVAFHVHHGLSSHADHWAEHCQTTCNLLDIACHTARVAVERSASVEAAARAQRYAALERLCHEHGTPLLLVAHHATDQVETVLLRLLRGSGIAGLQGMPATRALGDSVLARPFLDLPRALLADTAAAWNLTTVDDASNHDVRFSRSALRATLLPAARQVAPDLEGRVASATRHARSAQTLLDTLAAIDLGEPVSARLDLAHLRVLGEVRSANLLRFWLRQHGVRVPSERRLAAWQRQWRTPSVQTYELPCDGRALRISRDLLTLVDVSPASPARRDAALQWASESQLDVPSWGGTLAFHAADGPGIDIERLRRGPLQLRTRRGGERLQLQLDRPSRTLKNLYQEAGIDVAARRQLPLVYAGDELIFAAGLGMNLRQCAHDDKPRVTLDWIPSQMRM